MELKRVQIGVFKEPRFIYPPKECVDAKTITLNELKVLTIFKDRRLMAVSYLDTLFKVMGVPNHEALVRWFYEEMPDNGYLEMDYPRGRLCFCILEKK